MAASDTDKTIVLLEFVGLLCRRAINPVLLRVNNNPCCTPTASIYKWSGPHPRWLVNEY